ncbi:MAG: hypothetical protein QW544_05125 [Candidatus Caldarchaeum sp.]
MSFLFNRREPRPAPAPQASEDEVVSSISLLVKRGPKLVVSATAETDEDVRRLKQLIDDVFEKYEKQRAGAGSAEPVPAGGPALPVAGKMARRH